MLGPNSKTSALDLKAFPKPQSPRVRRTGTRRCKRPQVRSRGLRLQLRSPLSSGGVRYGLGAFRAEGLGFGVKGGLLKRLQVPLDQGVWLQQVL